MPAKIHAYDGWKLIMTHSLVIQLVGHLFIQYTFKDTHYRVTEILLIIEVSDDLKRCNPCPQVVSSPFTLPKTKWISVALLIILC